MASDVFISYAKVDETAAFELVDLLEARSFACWIAPRNVIPGSNWSGELVRAIRTSEVFLVLLSNASMLSVAVAEEIRTAFEARRPTLPIRLVEDPPSESLWFYLGSRQHLNAYPRALIAYEDEIAGALRALILPREAPMTTVSVAAGESAQAPSPPDEIVADRVAPLLLPPATIAPLEVVGFDLGHGETAVARASLESDARPAIVAVGGKRSQVSAIGFRPDRRFVLGEEAILDPTVSAALICFKEPPGRSAITRKLLADYLGAYDRRLREDGHIRGGEESHFFVGCPSGWSRDEIQLYEDTLQQSGIPRLKVVKESRAALLNVIESGGITKQELQANVLIVDLGSSTTDLTLVTNATVEAPMDFGLELGAALIDKRVLHHAIRAHAQRDELEAALARQQAARERCEFLCRRVKEQYFSNEGLYRASNRAASAGVETVDGGIAFVPAVDTPLMDAVLGEPLPELGGRSWIEAFRALLVETRARLQGQGCTPAVVVATGGASRMGFVQPICLEVFPDSKFRRDEEPEASIARGLALWGRVFLRTADFEAAVTQIAGTHIPALVASHADGLVQRIAPAAAAALVEASVRPALESWRAGKIATIDRIERAVKTRVEKWLAGPDFDRLIGDAVEAWWQTVQPQLDELTDDVCRRYGIPRGSLTINPVLRSVSHPTLSAGESVCAGVTSSLQVVLLAIGAAVLFFAGPGGWIVGLVGALAGLESGDEVRKAKIWKSLRPTLLSDARIATCVGDVKKKLQASLKTELKDGPALAEMSRQISGELNAVLLERADEARLLIR